ncbi:MAG: hypothetical protein ACRDV3_00320 [Acidothermaceae bacterium]
MTVNTVEDHERWAERAAAHVLSAIDDAEDARYVEHAAACPACQELERELSATLADLAQIQLPILLSFPGPRLGHLNSRAHAPTILRVTLITR